jgi:hypothetical protein
MIEFLWGGSAACALVAAVFFLRFFRQSGDRLFAFFAAAFAAFAVHWTLLAMSESTDETRPYLYMVRLLAFGLIVVGVADKNRRARRA